MVIWFKKHSDIFSQTVLVQRKPLKTIGFVLVILLAVIPGNYIALTAVQHINNNWTRFIVGIFIGLLVGILVGFSFHRGWTRLLQAISKTSSSQGAPGRCERRIPELESRDSSVAKNAPSE